jgi:hypothetical protein
MLEALRPLLASFTLDELEQRIAAYESNSATRTDYGQIWRELSDVVHVNREPGFVMPAPTRPIAKGTRLYRARRITDLSSDIERIRHAWEPKPHQARQGRLNGANEPLLYAAMSPGTAFFEARIRVGDHFAMMEFETKSDFDIALIHDPGDVPGLDNLEQQKLSRVFRFLEDVFTQRVEPGSTHKYGAPEAVAKLFFDYPPEISAGWLYRSVADPGGLGANLAFRPETGHEVLELLSVEVCGCESIEDSDKPVRFKRLEVFVPDHESGMLLPPHS